MGVIVLSLWVFVIYWFRMNHIMVSIDEDVGGVFLNKSFRARVSKGRKITGWLWWKKVTPIPKVFYPLWDIKSKNKVEGLEYDKVKDDLVITESVPVFGIRKTLNLVKDKEKGYTAWHPPLEVDNKGLINNVRMVIINKLREEIYESTDNTTKADMLYKVVLPMALVILAFGCLIFFPKIYGSIIDSGSAALQAATVDWTNMLDKVKPLG